MKQSKKIFSVLLIFALTLLFTPTSFGQSIKTSSDLDLSDVTIADINKENVQEYFVRSVNANVKSHELQPKVFIHALNMMGGYQNPLVAAISGIGILEMENISDLWLTGAWESSTLVLVGVRRPLDVRARFYIISALDTQNRVLELKLGQNAVIDQSSTINQQKGGILSSTGFDFLVNSNLAATCFIKSDFGGSVESVLVSERFIKCNKGDE